VAPEKWKNPKPETIFKISKLYEVRTTLEGRMNTREKGSGRPRTMFLDWLLKTEEDNISYDELKMLAQDRSRWCQ